MYVYQRSDWNKKNSEIHSPDDLTKIKKNKISIDYILCYKKKKQSSNNISNLSELWLTIYNLLPY